MSSGLEVDRADRVAALVTLGRWLKSVGYRFVTVTPETHRRVLDRSSRRANSLRDVFGWSRPFDRALLPSAMLESLLHAGFIDESSSGYRSHVRFASLGEDLVAHSSYPTTQEDAVFFGPDTYRFCAMVARARVRARRCVDVGCGSGAAGMIAYPTSERVTLADISPAALLHAEANAQLAGCRVELVQSDVLREVEGAMDLVLANPPYMLDDARRVYRDGGGSHGEGLAVRIVAEALSRLDPGGSLLLYTGAAIIEGEDVFWRAVQPLLTAELVVHYEELDPDVFGDELDRPRYAEVERIAAVALRVTLPGPRKGSKPVKEVPST